MPNSTIITKMVNFLIVVMFLSSITSRIQAGQNKTKRRGKFFLLPVPHPEALACPNCRNEQRRSPRRYVFARQWWRTIHIQWASTVALLLTISLGTARFLDVKYKASSKRRKKMSVPDTCKPTLKRASAPKHRKFTKTYSILNDSLEKRFAKFVV